MTSTPEDDLTATRPLGCTILLLQVEEDPDREFPPTTADEPPLSGPRLIEVGISGPGAHPALWRRAWRDKILPALVNFNPDIIMVSAGFDAHRKDVINYRSVKNLDAAGAVMAFAEPACWYISAQGRSYVDV